MNLRIVSTTLAAAVILVACQSAESATIYFTETITGVFSVSSSGNNLHTYVSNDNFIYAGIATDVADGKLYWTTSTRGTPPSIGAIDEANLNGSNVQQIDTDNFSPSEQSTPRGIAVDPIGGKIYWADTTDYGHSGLIYTANLNGSNPTTILDYSYPDQVALDVRDGLIYWNNFVDGDIVCSNLNGSNAHVVMSGLTDVYGLALDLVHNKIYYDYHAGGTNPTIAYANLDGSDPVTLLSGLGDPREMAVDPTGGELYWTNLTGGSIQDCNLNGSNLQTVISGLNEPFGIALAVPEPSSLSIAALGAIGLALVAKRRKRSRCRTN